MSGDEIYTENKSKFSGCRNAREIIKKKNVGSNDYIYIKYVAKKKIKADGSDRKNHKVFFKESWINSYFKNIVTYPPAPDVIELKPNEKFYDEEGNILEIETRGERDVDKCFFLAKDVANAFGLKYKSVAENIQSYDRPYILGEDYVYFNCDKTSSAGSHTKTLFLKYHGVLRLLYASRTPHMRAFRKWMTSILFTIQMGHDYEKVELASKIAGANINHIKAVFNRNSSEISCVYLFSIGRACDLRKSLKLDKNIDDNDIIYKYGYTNNLVRRATEHNEEYGKLPGADVRLIIFKTIDPSLISKAEADLRKHFKNIKTCVDHNNYTELVYLSKKKKDLTKSSYDLTRNYYDTLEELYIGKLSNMRNIICAVNNELAMSKEKENTYKERERRIIAEYELKIEKLQAQIISN